MFCCGSGLSISTNHIHVKFNMFQNDSIFNWKQSTEEGEIYFGNLYNSYKVNTYQFSILSKTQKSSYSKIEVIFPNTT